MIDCFENMKEGDYMIMTYRQYKNIEQGIMNSIQENVQYPDLKEFLPQHLLEETMRWLHPEKTKDSKYIILLLDEWWEKNGSHLPQGISKSQYNIVCARHKYNCIDEGGFEFYENNVPERILGYLNE